MQISTFSSPRPAALTFGAYVTNQDKLSQLRDELVEQFPGGFSKYSNGSGIGFVNYPNDQRIGIHVMCEKEADKKALIKDLTERAIIKPEKKGAYVYKNALVGFDVVGTIRAL